MTIPVLGTQWLTLRPFRASDREPVADMNADPEVMRHFPSTLSREESDTFIQRIGERWAEDGHGLWAVERTSDGTMLGFVGLAKPRFEAPFTPAVEVGWRLTRQACGHGYATEAAEEALRHGFETLGLQEIVSFTTVANVRSRRVMERLGMTRNPVDDFQHPDLPPGHPIRPHVLYRLSRADWAARQANR